MGWKEALTNYPDIKAEDVQATAQHYKRTPEEVVAKLIANHPNTTATAQHYGKTNAEVVARLVGTQLEAVAPQPRVATPATALAYQPRGSDISTPLSRAMGRIKPPPTTLTAQPAPAEATVLTHPIVARPLVQELRPAEPVRQQAIAENPETPRMAQLREMSEKHQADVERDLTAPEAALMGINRGTARMVFAAGKVARGVAGKLGMPQAGAGDEDAEQFYLEREAAAARKYPVLTPVANLAGDLLRIEAFGGVAEAAGVAPAVSGMVARLGGKALTQELAAHFAQGGATFGLLDGTNELTWQINSGEPLQPMKVLAATGKGVAFGGIIGQTGAKSLAAQLPGATLKTKAADLIARMFVGASLFGGMAAIEGGGLEDVASSAALGAGFQLMGSGNDDPMLAGRVANENVAAWRGKVDAAYKSASEKIDAALKTATDPAEVARLQSDAGKLRAWYDNAPTELETTVRGVLGKDFVDALKPDKPVAWQELDKLNTALKANSDAANQWRDYGKTEETLTEVKPTAVTTKTEPRWYRKFVSLRRQKEARRGISPPKEKQWSFAPKTEKTSETVSQPNQRTPVAAPTTKVDAGLTPKTQPVTDLTRTTEQTTPATGGELPTVPLTVQSALTPDVAWQPAKPGEVKTGLRARIQGVEMNVTEVNPDGSFKVGKSGSLIQPDGDGGWKFASSGKKVSVESAEGTESIAATPLVAPVVETNVETKPPGKRGRPTKESVLERRVAEVTSAGNGDAAKAAQAELDAYRAAKTAPKVTREKKVVEPAKEVVPVKERTEIVPPAVKGAPIEMTADEVLSFLKDEHAVAAASPDAARELNILRRDFYEQYANSKNPAEKEAYRRYLEWSRTGGKVVAKNGLGVGERTRPAAEPPAPPKVEVATKSAVRGLQPPKERIRVSSEQSPNYQPWREVRPGDVLASDELRIVSDVPGMGKSVETRISPDVSVSPSGIEGHLDDGRPVVLKYGADGWVMTVKGGVPVKVDNLEVRSLRKDRSKTAVVTSDGFALTPKEVKAAKEDAAARLKADLADAPPRMGNPMQVAERVSDGEHLADEIMSDPDTPIAKGGGSVVLNSASPAMVVKGLGKVLNFLTELGGGRWNVVSAADRLSDMVNVPDRHRLGNPLETFIAWTKDPTQSVKHGVEVLFGGNSLLEVAHGRYGGHVNKMVKGAAKEYGVKASDVGLAVAMRVTEIVHPGTMAALESRIPKSGRAAFDMARAASSDGLPSLEALAQEVRGVYDAFIELGERLHIFKRKDGYDISIYHDNSTEPEQWKGATTSGSPAGLTPKVGTTRGMARKTVTWLDAYVEAAEGTRRPLWSTDIREIVPRYIKDVGQVAVNRAFIRWAEQFDPGTGPLISRNRNQRIMKTNEDGTVSPTGEVYAKIHSDIFRTSGRFPRDLYAPPDIAEFLSRMFAPSWVQGTPIVKQMAKFNNLLKRTILSTSGFHAWAFGRELILGSYTLRDPVSSYKMGKELVEGQHPLISYMVEHGLRLFSEREYSVPDKERWVGGKVAHAWETLLFNRVGAYWKAMSAVEAFNDQMRSYPKANPDVVAREVARMTNNRFGGLDWRERGFDRTTRDIAGLGLLAPDWTLSNFSALTDMIPWVYNPVTRKVEFNEMRAKLHAKLWLRVLSRGIVGSQAINMMLNRGSFTWEEDQMRRRRGLGGTLYKGLHVMDVDVTNLYRWLENQTGLDVLPQYKRVYIALPGHWIDPVKMFTQPQSFVIGKLSPLLQAALNMSIPSGTDAWGRHFAVVQQMFPRGAKHPEDLLTGRGALYVSDREAVTSASQQAWEMMPARLAGTVKGWMPILAELFFGVFLGQDLASVNLIDMLGLRTNVWQPNLERDLGIVTRPRPHLTGLGKVLMKLQERKRSE